MAVVAAPVLAFSSLFEKARRWSLYLAWPRALHAAMRARRVEAHRSSLPETASEAVEALTALNGTAIWRTSLSDESVLQLPPDARAELLRRLDALKTPGATTTTIQSSSDQMPPEVYAAGLAPRLLALVERYVQTPILYLGAAAKCERADGAAINQRLWHTDMEDLQVLRLIVYLSPVAADDGPFEYLPAERSAELRRQLRYRSGYLTEEIADRHILADDRVAATGPEGAVIAFDGARVFHRAKPPVRRDRYSVTYSYTSRWPLELRATTKPHAMLRAALVHLPTLVMGCVPL